MDLPVWVVADSARLDEWSVKYAQGGHMPLKPLQVFAQLMLESLSDPEVSSSRELAPQPCITTSSTWLPTIQKRLPHDWAISSTVTTKAVKSDDAMIDCGMWDKRVTLVLEWDHTKLAVLRKLAFSGWQRRLRREFQKYMCTKYGASWLTRVLESRRQAVLKSAREGSEKQLPHSGG
jgi:hypothetical protein